MKHCCIVESPPKVVSLLENSCDLALAPSFDMVLRLTLTCDPSLVLAPIDLRLFSPNCVNEVQDALLSGHILWALTDFSPDRWHAIRSKFSS